MPFSRAMVLSKSADAASHCDAIDVGWQYADDPCSESRRTPDWNAAVHHPTERGVEDRIRNPVAVQHRVKFA